VSQANLGAPTGDEFAKEKNNAANNRRFIFGSSTQKYIRFQIKTMGTKHIAFAYVRSNLEETTETS